MQERVELGHVPGDEDPVGGDGIARQRHPPRLGDVFPHVAKHLVLRLREGDARGELGQQPGRGVHLPHHVFHLVQRLGRRLDDQVKALAQRSERTVGNQAGDLDQGIPLQVEPCHLTVDPHQPVRHPSSLGARPGVSGLLAPHAHSRLVIFSLL